MAGGSAVAAMQSIGATGSLVYLGAGAIAVPAVGGAGGAGAGAAGAAVAQALIPDATFLQQRHEPFVTNDTSILEGTFHIQVAGGTDLRKDLLSRTRNGTVSRWSHDDCSGLEKWRFQRETDNHNVYTIHVGGGTGTDDGESCLSCSPGGVVDLRSHDDASARQK